VTGGKDPVAIVPHKGDGGHGAGAPSVANGVAPVVACIEDHAGQFTARTPTGAGA